MLCIESCSRDVSTECIRCNLSFTWYHTHCVGIKDLDGVEAWVCADCRASPKTVKFLKGQCEALLQTTEKMYITVETLTEKIDRKFDHLNDRLTTLSNQNKSSSQSCTSSLTDIHHDMKTFRTEIDKKNQIPYYQRANSLLIRSNLSQSQSTMLSQFRRMTKQNKHLKKNKARRLQRK